VVPLLPPATYFRAFKISKRFDEDITAVLGAFRIGTEGGHIASARIAYGGMAATPKRALAVERHPSTGVVITAIGAPGKI